jgi:hypothetical protein
MWASVTQVSDVAHGPLVKDPEMISTDILRLGTI